jgi:hypothetical protein
LAVSILVCCLAVAAVAKCPTGDVNEDCRVDFRDLLLLAEQWLGDPNGAANLNADGQIDGADLAILTDRWGKVGCPIVINELLAHSHDVEPDWIELYNVSSVPVDLGGWTLSDDENDLTKYRIPAGTIIEPNDYLVFYEDQHFGNVDDPNVANPFKMSENGEVLYVYSGQDKTFGECLVVESFGASETGTSFGRYLKSTGTYNFVPMSEPTPGAANAYPLVGPIVINEIMYRPASDGDAEYVELLNISNGPVTLFDFDALEPWRFVDGAGIEFAFPTDMPLTVLAGQHVVLARDRWLVRQMFGVQSDIPVYEWDSGRLANSGEKLRLLKPGDVDEAGTRYWIEADRVNYSDGAHGESFEDGFDPWPREADGFGMSLNRLSPLRYGNDPNNWQATLPTPGAPND